MKSCCGHRPCWDHSPSFWWLFWGSLPPGKKSSPVRANCVCWDPAHIQMPLSKTRAFYLLTAMFILVTVISSVMDHARTNFENPWLWLPTFSGIFATIVVTVMGFLPHPTRGDQWTYVAALVLITLVGLTGAVLHVLTNLTGQNAIIVERFLRGAPFLAPLLFANMGLLGFLVLLED